MFIHVTRDLTTAVHQLLKISQFKRAENHQLFHDLMRFTVREINAKIVAKNERV
jgi:hypothetical protein